MTQQEAEVKLKVNNKEALDKINALEQEAEKLRTKFNECFRKGDQRGLNATTKELNRVNKQIQNMRTNAANIQAAMKRLNEASPKELKRTLALINQELNSGRVPRGSKEWKEYCEQVKRVKRELAEVNEEMEDQGSFLDKLKDKFNDWGAAAAAGLAAMAGVVMSGKAAVQAYADRDSALANAQKFTGMTREEVEKLNEEFKKMDTRTSVEDLNELAAAAGRLGKSTVEDVMGFVRAADILGVAMDELGEDAPQIISQLAGIFNLEGELGTERAMLSVGSTINTLSQNCAAAAPNLVDFASRLGAVANQTGMTIDEMLAFGALLDSNRVSVEKSSTAMQAVITKMYADPADFAKKVGLDVNEFTEALKRSSTEGIMMFVEALSQMDNMQQAATLKDLGAAGAGVVQTFQTLAGKTDELKTRMNDAKTSFLEAKSATDEFNVQNNTVQAGLDKAKKNFSEMAVNLGQKLVPVMRYAISGSSLLMRTIAALVDFIIKYKGAIITLTASIIAYQVAAGWAVIQTKLLAAWTAICKGAVFAWTVVTQAAAVVTALFTGGVTKATVAFKVLSATLKASPIGLLVAGITAVVAGLTAWALSTDKLTAKQKALNEIEKEAHRLASDELTDLKILYEKTQNQNIAMDKRIEAVEELQRMYPAYFSNLTTEAILAGQAQKAYEDLTTAILNKARAEGRKKKIAQLEEEIIDLETEYKSQYDEVYMKLVTNGIITDTGQLGANGAGAFAAEYTLYKRLKAVYEDPVSKKRALQRELTDDVVEYEANAEPTGTPEVEGTPCPKCGNYPCTCPKYTPPTPDEVFNNQLSATQAANDIAQAQNLAAYSIGTISYEQYLKNKEQLDADYLEARMELYENAGKTETSEYAALITEEANRAIKAVEEARKKNIAELEADHKATEEALTEAFFDPSSPDFQNQKLYNQRLLEEDVRFLRAKAELYQKGSKERLDIEKEINDLLARDQLQKQKETAEAFQWYSKTFAKMSAEERNKVELDMLKELLDKKLITEQQYQEARRELLENAEQDDRQRRKREQQDRLRKIEEEYDDAKAILDNSTDAFGKAALDIMIEWQKLMDNIANGEDIWNNIGKIAQSSLALISSALSQYTAYANAERDIEISKIEERYDKEIKAAGNNSKKKEQLEAAKEKAIANTKKKYADRAMKIEIAQALAQTAVNAILGYQAGLKFPFPASTFMPAVLAGLAVAQGAMQIAVIKKQHEAQAAGYYEGGFTGGKNYRREAGVVHEGEFVMNHEAVNNPHLTPLLRMLDSAQRTNTVGSLTAADVSAALGQGRGVSARGEAVAGSLAPTIITTTVDTTPLDRLNAILADGINSVVIMDGERGLYRKYQDYEKLLNNPKR